ncbi:MAG TPA: toll/interleukin-1 receptor domain-containing protein [Acidimicrobiales bacterium]|nr:toll/interleukin-1 receptor domain-containing protein [Acidimicrobiales bacterium]
MADVLVSYSRQDSSFVTRFASAIESSGKKVWVDTSDIEVFPLAIRSAIEVADAFLFIILPSLVSSGFWEQEVDFALSLNKRLVQELRPRVPDDELPGAIREHNWIPFDERTEFDQPLARVLSALDTDLEHRRSHTRSLTDASSRSALWIGPWHSWTARAS